MTVSRNTTSVVVLDCGGGRRAGIFGPAACASAALAQSAERFTRNEYVVGSIPTGGSFDPGRSCLPGLLRTGRLSCDPTGVPSGTFRGVGGYPARALSGMTMWLKSFLVER